MLHLGKRRNVAASNFWGSLAAEKVGGGSGPENSLTLPASSDIRPGLRIRSHSHPLPLPFLQRPAIHHQQPKVLVHKETQKEIL